MLLEESSQNSVGASFRVKEDMNFCEMGDGCRKVLAEDVH